MDVTANAVSDVQLTQWMQGAVGRSTANVDEWNYAMERVAGGGPYTDLGFQIVGGVRQGVMEADEYLARLRAYQQGVNYTYQSPGGNPSNTTPPLVTAGGSPAVSTGAPPTATGQGVLGMTNCAVCQQIKQQPWILVIIAVAVYFLVFKD